MGRAPLHKSRGGSTEALRGSKKLGYKMTVVVGSASIRGGGYVHCDRTAQKADIRYKNAYS